MEKSSAYQKGKEFSSGGHLLPSACLVVGMFIDDDYDDDDDDEDDDDDDKTKEQSLYSQN